MKCSNCNSPMFVANEAASKKSHVTFFRCSLCVSGHVSSEPIRDPVEQNETDYFAASNIDSKRFLQV